MHVCVSVAALSHVESPGYFVPLCTLESVLCAVPSAKIVQ